MQIAEKKKKYTIEDYLMLEEGAPFQLIDYDLIMSPSPTPAHQLVSIRLSQLILNYFDSINHNGFLVAAPMDVSFDDGNVFQPDLVYVSAERRAEIVKTHIQGAPDLVIEILSPSTGYYDLRHKKDIYEKYGVKEYIVIDPIKETFEIYSLKNSIYVLHQKSQKPQIVNSILLSGLTFDLEKLFK